MPRLRERSSFTVLAAAAPTVLLLAHLLPTSGPGLALRLAGATACVLVLPGALLLRALAWPSSPAVAVAASFALSLALVAFALALVFLFGTSLLLVVVVLVVVSAFAVVPAVLRGTSEPVPRTERRAVVAVLGIAIPFATVVWRFSGLVSSGDVYFHMARAQKLYEFDSLSTLSTVSEFEDGGLHIGYAFPLWQAVDALIARFAGVDVTDVVVYLPAILVLLSLVIAYAAGSAVFRSAAGGLAFVAAQVAHFGFLGGGGYLAGTGSFEFLSQPLAASHLLLATAALALVFSFAADGGWVLLAALGAAAASLTAVHPTYTAYVALIAGGFLVARALLAGGWEPPLTRIALGLGAIVAPFGLYSILFLPLLRETSVWTPSATVRASELAHYGNSLTAVGDWFYLSPGGIVRAGAVVVAGLLAVPLAGFAGRQPWAALVLGGSLAILIVVLTPPLFTILSDVFSVSQARRLPHFLPIAYAVTGACVILSRFRGLGVGLAAAAGSALVLLYPGEFTALVPLPSGGIGYVYEGRNPEWAVWVAVAGGLVALAVAVRLRPLGPNPGRWTAAAAAAFVVPVAVAGLARLEDSSAQRPLTPGIVAALRSEVTAGDVVFSDARTAYLVAGFAPVYVNASPLIHVVDTPANRPKARARAAARFLAGTSITDATRDSILDRAQADWVVVDKQLPHPEVFLRRLPLVYEDSGYALYEVGS